MDDRQYRELNQEARLLQRKLTFWRRAATLLFGLVAVVLLVMWQRYSAQKDTCAGALRHFADLAVSSDLASNPAGLMELQWDNLEPSPDGYRPHHFEIIDQNWGRKARGNERIPLAVCREPHTSLLARARHVLYRMGGELKVEWVPESELAAIKTALQKSKK